MKALAWTMIALLAAAAVLFAAVGRERLLKANTWQQLASPGELSEAHASLKNNCAACHSSIKGVEASKCILCHANNQSLLQRQPTAFHANIAECAACHLEHQGRVARISEMDHVALAHIGCKMLESSTSPTLLDMAKAKRWLEQTTVSARPSDHRAAEEALLNCAACHSTKDKHLGFFGADCAQCHGTAQWTIPQFRHPAPTSHDCAQCHQAPPSHYMEHFRMISMMVAGQPHARVEQCFLCHQTTSWNDIKGVGFYKHH